MDSRTLNIRTIAKAHTKGIFLNLSLPVKSLVQEFASRSSPDRLARRPKKWWADVPSQTLQYSTPPPSRCRPALLLEATMAPSKNNSSLVAEVIEEPGTVLELLTLWYLMG